MEEERRRREEAERRLQDETAHRQRLVEEEVKMREKHFSQVSGAGSRRGEVEEVEEGREEETREWVRGETLRTRGCMYGRIKDCLGEWRGESKKQSWTKIDSARN